MLVLILTTTASPHRGSNHVRYLSPFCQNTLLQGLLSIAAASQSQELVPEPWTLHQPMQSYGETISSSPPIKNTKHTSSTHPFFGKQIFMEPQRPPWQ
mmetsp:Transcript_35560/g.72778  ORF Transcript_35560/g.72778 Transcript_35560/m.72778 type:complete len:98 (+) Transcript_35560:333-626(+)